MDKKNIIIPLVIMIVAITVGLNFEEFTGQASRLTILQESLAEQPKGEGSVSVTPKVITAGEEIYITITPGDACIDNEITIYREGRKIPVARFKKAFIPSSRDSARYQVTSRSKYCEEVTVQYKTWNSWAEGDYYVQVKELPIKVTGKIKERTVYYTDSFKVKSPERYPKIVISTLGDLKGNPQIISGQRYIFQD